MAKYTLYNHTITLHKDGTVTCDTCSLSAAVVDIIPVMHAHHIRNCTIDGALIQRI